MLIRLFALKLYLTVIRHVHYTTVQRALRMAVRQNNRMVLRDEAVLKLPLYKRDPSENIIRPSADGLYFRIRMTAVNIGGGKKWEKSDGVHAITFLPLFECTPLISCHPDNRKKIKIFSIEGSFIYRYLFGL